MPAVQRRKELQQPSATGAQTATEQEGEERKGTNIKKHEETQGNMMIQMIGEDLGSGTLYIHFIHPGIPR
jgi:hypothetical protein